MEGVKCYGRNVPGRMWKLCATVLRALSAYCGETPVGGEDTGGELSERASWNVLGLCLEDKVELARR